MKNLFALLAVFAVASAPWAVAAAESLTGARPNVILMITDDQGYPPMGPMMDNENVPMSPTRPFHEWYHQQLQSSGIPDWKPSE